MKRRIYTIISDLICLTILTCIVVYFLNSTATPTEFDLTIELGNTPYRETTASDDSPVIIKDNYNVYTYLTDSEARAIIGKLQQNRRNTITLRYVTLEDTLIAINVSQADILENRHTDNEYEIVTQWSVNANTKVITRDDSYEVTIELSGREIEDILHTTALTAQYYELYHSRHQDQITNLIIELDDLRYIHQRMEEKHLSNFIYHATISRNTH